MEVTAQVLGLAEFDPGAFLAQVKEIQVGENNTLTYIFHDARTASTTWPDRSRAESWTKAMKESARKTALEQEPLERNPDGRFLKRKNIKE